MLPVVTEEKSNTAASSKITLEDSANMDRVGGCEVNPLQTFWKSQGSSHRPTIGNFNHHQGHI